MESTGQRRTKQYATDDAHRLRALDYNPRNNPRGNAISKLAYQIAGSTKKFYALDKEMRKEVRENATLMYELGAEFGIAERAERTELRGFVYVINHPLLEGVKVGRAYNPESRLRGYQTGCPRREYRLRFATYFENCHAAEARIHARLNAHQLAGEWFSIQPDEAQECIEAFARLNEHQLENTS